jgi:hypothetical protein
VNVAPNETKGGTLIGELQVSKSLIDGALAAAGIDHASRAFRAGNLSYNPHAPEMLARLGYHVDSTRAVGEVLSNFPFRLMTEWPDPRNVDVYELPVTLEDEAPPRLDQRVDAALEIIAANADNGAPTSMLIHPNVTDYKLAAEEEIVTRLPEGVKAIDPATFGAFWRARDQVAIIRIDYDVLESTVSVTLLPALDTKGLSLRVGSDILSVEAPAGAKLVAGPGSGKLVLLPDLPAQKEATIVLRYQP